MTLSAVSRTAVAVAAARALESTRDDALIDDPYAARLVVASGMSTPFPERWPDDPTDPLHAAVLLGASYIGLRTALIDDELLHARMPQIVLLGSGLDTRAWRLDAPADTAFFELDAAPVLDLLTATLPHNPRRHPVIADVTEPWASRLVAAGFRPDRPSHWVLEGLLPYLAADDQAALFDDIVHLAAPGSHVVLECAAAIDDTPAANERIAEYAALTGIPLDEVLARTHPPDPVAHFQDAGWCTTALPLAAVERRFARGIRPAGAADDQRAGFVLAVNDRPA